MGVVRHPGWASELGYGGPHTAQDAASLWGTRGGPRGLAAVILPRRRGWACGHCPILQLPPPAPANLSEDSCVPEVTSHGSGPPRGRDPIESQRNTSVGMFLSHVSIPVGYIAIPETWQTCQLWPSRSRACYLPSPPLPATGSCREWCRPTPGPLPSSPGTWDGPLSLLRVGSPHAAVPPIRPSSVLLLGPIPR